MTKVSVAEKRADAVAREVLAHGIGKLPSAVRSGLSRLKVGPSPDEREKAMEDPAVSLLANEVLPAVLPDPPVRLGHMLYDAMKPYFPEGAQPGGEPDVPPAFGGGWQNQYGRASRAVPASGPVDPPGALAGSQRGARAPAPRLRRLLRRWPARP